MKITAVTISDGEGGISFSIAGTLGPRVHELDGTDADDLAVTINRQIEAFWNNGAGPGDGTEGSPEPEPQPEAPVEGNGRRRRGGAAAADTASASTTNTTSASPSGGRKRRGSAEAPAAETPPAGEGGGRKRRGSAAGAESTSSAPDQSQTTASPSDGRRRRGGTVAKVITDADLTKAASEAGRQVGTPEVVKIIEEYEDAEGYVCENVAQIKPEDRQAFLDALAKLTA